MCMTARNHVENVAPLCNIDPRVKAVAIFGFVAVVSSLTSKPLLAMAVVLITGMALFSGMTPGMLLRRIAMVLPFTGFMLVFLPFMVPGEVAFSISPGPFSLNASAQGLDRAAILSLRVLSAVVAVSVLTATTPFSELMQALRGLKVPDVFVQLLEFTIRYFHVLSDEVQRMKIARKSRCFETGRSLFSIGTYITLGQLVGVLFARSWDRGERIYRAMLSRGYPGADDAKDDWKRPEWRDICWGAGILAMAVSLRLFESGALKGGF
ncbi:MAG: cobalt ECF transporter T component CbiQ [Bacillota bacterium]